MLEIEVPGYKNLAFAHLVLDLNGTLAVDGAVPAAVSARVRELGEQLNVFLLTADTFGTAGKLAGRLGAEVVRLQPGGREAEQKLEFVRSLGTDTCVAVGNGANDLLMLEAAALGIGVLGKEGAAPSVVAVADILVTSPLDALDLLLVPKRLVATLRR